MARQVELDVYPVFEQTLAHTAEALGAPMACLHLYDDDKDVLRLVRGHNLDPIRNRSWSRLDRLGSAPPARAFAGDKPLELIGPDASPGLAGTAAAPVRGAQVPLGALSVIWAGPDAPPPDRDRMGFLETAACLLGLAIEHAGLVAELVDNMSELVLLKNREERRAGELARLNEQLQTANQKLEELSITDGLTGLHNRRYFMERLEQELTRSRRQGQPICLLMADLDHFKRVNDTLGHPAGDEALRRFAEWLRLGVRQVDLLGRYGGEEFVVALLNCDQPAGLQVAEKIRRIVEANSPQPPFDGQGGFTVSIGLARFRDSMGAEELIAAADQALYRAKRGGRNRVAAA